MAGLVEALRVGGLSALEELIGEAREESLHLEFKQVSDPGSGTLSRDDRKRVARAACGMANAEGGAILVGVASRKVAGLDVADALAPMANASRLRGLLASALPEMLGPQHPALAVAFVATGPGPGVGILAVDVPPSDRRPHMSLLEQRYFRRGSQGTTVMLHGEVRDLMLAPREGVLELTVGAQGGTIIGGRTYVLQVVLGLRNAGRVPVKAPFLRLAGVATSIHQEASQQGFVPKARGPGEAIYVANAATVLHVDDEVKVATVASGIHFGELGASTPWAHVQAVGAGAAEERFGFGDFSLGGQNQPGSVPDQNFVLDASFGAENVQVSRPKPRFFGRPELFRLFRGFVRQ